MAKDIYIYLGDIAYSGYWSLTDCIKKKKEQKELNKTAILCIATLGGDPNAGYRIGRALQHNYDNFSALILGPCKSAGTLLAIAADELIMGDTAELGPLDIQIKKNDELDEANSGLDIMTALSSLIEMAGNNFSEIMKSIHDETKINAKLSGDMSAKIIDSLISPISAQIDPLKFGEHQRALNIATRYGANLNDRSCNLKNGALSEIIASYPSHGYVIDRKEARELFNKVISPDNKLTIELYEEFSSKIINSQLRFYGSPIVFDYEDYIKVKKNGSSSSSEQEQPDEGTPSSDETDKVTDSEPRKSNKRNAKDETVASS